MREETKLINISNLRTTQPFCLVLPIITRQDHGNRRHHRHGLLRAEIALLGLLCFSKNSPWLFLETLIYAKPLFAPLRMQ